MSTFRDTALRTARRKFGVALFTALLLVASASLVLAAAAKPDFAVSAAPTSQTVTQGTATTVNYTVSVARQNGFAGTVALSFSGLPTGASAKWPNNQTTYTLPANASAATLTVTTAASTPAGSYTPAVTGTGTIANGANGTVGRTTNFTLVVQAPAQPNFSMAASPGSQSINQGDLTVYNLTATRSGGFTGAITLSASGLPAGTTAAFDPAQLTGTATTSSVQIETSQSTPTGTYTITITGNGAGLSGARTTTVTLVVNELANFQITGNLSGALILGANPGRSIDLSITNPYNQALTVSAIQAKVTGITKAGCGSENFVIDQLAAGYSVTVPRNSTQKLSTLGTHQLPAVRWVDLPKAQNACLGTTLTFNYTGSGTTKK